MSFLGVDLTWDDTRAIAQGEVPFWLRVRARTAMEQRWRDLEAELTGATSVPARELVVGMRAEVPGDSEPQTVIRVTRSRHLDKVIVRFTHSVRMFGVDQPIRVLSGIPEGAS